MKSDISKQARFFRHYNSVQVRLYSYLLTVVHNRNDAEDILQETAIVLWEKFDEFQEGTSFGAWAVRIAGFKALEFMRHNRKTRMFFDESFYESICQEAEESTVDVPERLEALHFCLNKVPDPSKKLLAMRYMKDIPIRRISHQTGRSAAGLYQTFTRLIGLLRDCMDKYIARETLS